MLKYNRNIAVVITKNWFIKSKQFGNISVLDYKVNINKDRPEQEREWMSEREHNIFREHFSNARIRG